MTRTRIPALLVVLLIVGTALLDGQTPAPAPDLTGRTSIHDAAAKGDLQTVKAAIAADSTLVDAEKPPNKKTALHYAAQNGHADVVAFLLDKGADVFGVVALFSEPAGQSRRKLGIDQEAHYAVRSTAWSAWAAANSSAATMSSASRYGKSTRISSRVDPDARRSRMSLTRIRMPRMQGRPPHCSGLTVMRCSWLMLAVPTRSYHRVGMAVPAKDANVRVLGLS